MNYRRYYNDIINKAKNRQVPPVYTELHHILPRSLGGTDQPSNLVALTAQEHFVVHKLLSKAYSIEGNREAEYKMVGAWTLMCSFNKVNYSGYKPNSRDYKIARMIQINGCTWINEKITFIQRDGDEFTGTRYEFLSYIDDWDREINMPTIINGGTSSNWAIKNLISDLNEFMWKTVVITNGVKHITCFDCDLQKLTRLSFISVKSLLDKSAATRDGWWIESINGVYLTYEEDKKITPRMKEIEYTVSNGVNEITGNIIDISNNLNIPQHIAKRLVAGTIEYVNGWKSTVNIKERIKPFKRRPSTSNNDIGNTTFTLITANLEYTGTAYELRDILNIEINKFTAAIKRNLLFISGFWITKINNVPIDYSQRDKKVRTRFISQTVKFEWYNEKLNINENCTTVELSSKYNLSVYNLNRAFTESTTAYGWSIKKV